MKKEELIKALEFYANDDNYWSTPISLDTHLDKRTAKILRNSEKGNIVLQDNGAVARKALGEQMKDAIEGYNWTPVSKAMPKKHNERGLYPVLVTVIDNDGELFTTPMLTDGAGRWFTLNPPLGQNDEEIIAWQYFPRPYVGPR